MAAQVKKLIGIEIEPSAVASARKNARDNGCGNASFLLGDASSAKGLLSGVSEELSTASRVITVLDPPRKGCTEELLRYLATEVLPERIVYISCNPDTMGRDAAILSSFGYQTKTVYPVDLFPRTGHIECVTAFIREVTA